MITLKQLRYLSALEQFRHFGRAAEACAISQPALSMQIRDLERDLGVKLVERRPGDATLTEIGIEVARRGDQLLSGARDLEDFARHRGPAADRNLALGIIPTLAPYVLPKKFCRRCKSATPISPWNCVRTQTRQLLEELVRGSLDVVLLALPVEETELETIDLFEDTVPAGGACGRSAFARYPRQRKGGRSDAAYPAGRKDIVFAIRRSLIAPVTAGAVRLGSVQPVWRR